MPTTHTVTVVAVGARYSVNGSDPLHTSDAADELVDILDAVGSSGRRSARRLLDAADAFPGRVVTVEVPDE